MAVAELPRLGTTHVGSVPYTDVADVCAHLLEWLDIPAWPQMSRRTFRENMYVQYSRTLPRVVLDERAEKITLDTTGDLTPDLEAFYLPYLEDDVDAFALTPDYAAGFFAMLDLLSAMPGTWAKGQVTGPVSLGLTVTDQDLRAILYHDLLADVIVKNLAMVARWQARQLGRVRPRTIIFVDEPYMASFGSAYISLSREQVIAMFDEVFEGIHNEGALAGVHCCGNTDWSVLLDTTVDILNLDAYGYVENLALYPEELRVFLDRGGVIAWGIVPNNDAILNEKPETLAARLRQGWQLVAEKAAGRGVSITVDELASRSLLAPSCGLGSTTPEIADRALGMLGALQEALA